MSRRAGWTDPQRRRADELEARLDRLGLEVHALPDDVQMTELEIKVMEVLGPALVGVTERLVSAHPEDVGSILDEAEILMDSFEKEVIELVRNHK